MDEDINRGRSSGLLWAAAVLAAVAASVVCLVWLRVDPTELTLTDGSVVRIEGTTFGSSHSFSTQPIKEKVRRWLPAVLRPLLGTPGLRAQIRTAPNTLVIWTTRLDPSAPRASTSRNEAHCILDAHGCKFRCQQWVSTGALRKRLVGAAFEVFPRADKRFQYVICDNTEKVLGQLTVANPLPARPQRWVPERIPMTKTNGSLVAQVRALRRWDSIDPSAFRPDVWLVRALDWELWQKGPVWICDRFGNRSLGALCTNEPVWKIEAHFFRKAHAEFRPDEIWTITNIAIPPPGAATPLQKSNTLQGCTVFLEALKGADNLDSIPADPPTLLLRRTDSNSDAKILVRARDNAGRKLNTRADNIRSSYRGNHAIGIYPLADSKALDIEVLVQQPTRFEFFVEPPR